MKQLKFKSLKDVAKLEKLGVQIEFTAENEDTQPSDLMDDQDSIDYVIEEYNSGNEAAWFCAKVEVKYRGLEETDYLGGCSYKSFNQFTSEKNGYYRDMIATCISGINKQIAEINQDIQRRWDIRRAKNLVKPYGLFVVATREIPQL